MSKGRGPSKELAIVVELGVDGLDPEVGKVDPGGIEVHGDYRLPVVEEGDVL